MKSNLSFLEGAHMKKIIQTLDVILQRIETLFDPTIWDFDNTLEGGHPTLK